MTAERRLAKLEGALSPKAAALLWLEEAHRFGSLPAYVDWLIDQPVSAAPLERVPAQVRAAALEALRGLPRELVRVSSHQAVRDAIFLVELVLRLNSVAEETIRTEGLRYAALFWEMRAITAEAELDAGSAAPQGRRTIGRRWVAWRHGVSASMTNLHATKEARLLLERRYLDGRGALFPDLGRDWERLRESAERLAGQGDALRPPKQGRRRAPRSAEIAPSDPGLDALRARARREATALASRLVDDARAASLAVLGDAEGATSIAARQLRATVSGDSGPG